MRGLDKAIQLAIQSKSEIIALFVIKTNPTEIGIIKSMIKKTMMKKSKDFMKIARKKCSKHKIPFLDVIEFGDEGPKIVDYATKNKCSIIVMASRGLGSIKEAFLGSTSNYVLHKSKIPVLIVK